MQHFKALLIGTMILALGGCATALRGTRQKMLFETDPQGATITIDDEKYTTPAKVELKRKDEHSVVIAREGFRTVKFNMKAQWDGASLLSLALPGGSIMFATDTASGADRSFASVARIKLEPAPDANTPPLELTQYRGKLLTKDDYAKAMDEERRQRHSEVFEH
jgi:hypothetical protein